MLSRSCAIDLLGVLDARIGQVNQLLPIFGKILEAIEHKVLSYAEFFLVRDPGDMWNVLNDTHTRVRASVGVAN